MNRTKIRKRIFELQNRVEGCVKGHRSVGGFRASFTMLARWNSLSIG